MKPTPYIVDRTSTTNTGQDRDDAHLVDVFLKFGDSSFDKGLLFRRDITKSMDFDHTLRLDKRRRTTKLLDQAHSQVDKSTYPKLDVRTEIIQIGAQFLLQRFPTSLVCREMHEARRHDATLTFRCLQNLASEDGAGVRHREGSRPCTVFSFYDFVTTKLDALDERSHVGGRGELVRGLR
jgi:hypothetical protein